MRRVNVNILLSLVIAIASVCLCLVTQLQTVQCDSPISPAELWLSASGSTSTLVDLSVTGRSFNSSFFPLGWSVISDPVRRSCLRTNGNTRFPLPSTVLNTSYTITAWIQPSTDSYNYSPYIISTYTHADFGQNYGFFSLALSGVYTQAPPPGWTYKSFEVRQTIVGASGQPYPQGWVSGGLPFAPGTWQHISVTYDALTRVKKVYQQGILINSLTYTSTEMASWNGSSALYLGCLSGWPFRGCMDEIKYTIKHSHQIKSKQRI